MATEDTKKQIIEYPVPILSGTYFDLTKFDFSFKDICIYDVQSQAFEKYIQDLQPDNECLLNFIRDLQKNIHSEYEKKYAIVKNNPRKDFNYQDILNVWRLLLIIYPSNLQIEHVINYYEQDGFIENSSMSYYENRNNGESLFALEEDVPEVNEFSKRYFDRLNLQNYIGVAIENYLTSYMASHIHYEYLTLCIALESSIYGNQELTYRLRRTVAVLCGKDVFNCNIIYENLNKLYTLRSKIIHGEEYRIDKVIEYLNPLRAIVSRTIIELMIHNISSNKDLNDIITKLGFGDRSKITADWKSYKLNMSTVVASNWHELS
jgi:hypothetical protein